MTSTAASHRAGLTVYFDGSCPVCTREIAFFRDRDGFEHNEWIDVSTLTPAKLPDGVTRERALARFHVRTANGEIVAGARAFLLFWSQSPRAARLSRLSRWRFAVAVLDVAYAVFLRVRVLWRRA
ncbi:MAG: DUF393 domain-containing protein [Burkholderiales bacterium]